MRVKKLNATRRPRAGEDDAAGLGGDSSSTSSHSPSQWASPTKPSSASSSASHSLSPASDESFRRPETIEIGAGSPTDPTAAPPVQPHDVSELDLARQYYLGPSHTSTMANARTATSKNGAAAPTAVGASVRAGNDNASTPASWRENIDRAQRESLHQKIVEYLSTLKPNAPPKVLEKLPGLAYRMEEALFKMATSEHEYNDQATLPQRLTLIQQANARRLLQQQCPAVSPKDKDAAARPRKPLNEEQARVVFSCLQSWRQKLVNMYGTTPWDILPNKILAKVAVFIPLTTQELVVCGVANEQLERFGNSLLQEIEKVMNALNANANAAAAAQQLQAAMAMPRSSSPSGTKRPSSSGKATGTQGSTKARGTASDQAANKKRKTAADTATSAGVRLAAAVTPSYISANSFIAPTPTLIRPMDPAFLAAAAAASSLPALLPSGATTASSANGKKTLPTPPAFFPRIPVPGSAMDQDNRMHLLAQGVGQLSQQQDQQQKQHDSEKEIQALRWLLQESQREKALLEAEVQRLRQQGAK